MKRKLALLIVTCSILMSIVAPVTGPVPTVENPDPSIYRTNDHGLGT